MTPRENLLALLRREPYEYQPPEFKLCPSLVEEYKKQTHSDLHYYEYFEFPWRPIPEPVLPDRTGEYLPYYKNLKPGTQIDEWGVAHEPGSAAAKHMTHMCCPLSGMDDLEEIKKYPFPDFEHADYSRMKPAAEKIHAQNLVALGDMQMTIWERSWYLRGMEDLMMDMMTDDPIAEFIFETITQESILRAEAYARAGADILFFGDDIGMQRTPMMSEELYCKWIKPRLKRVIDAARAINPDVLIEYHSCGCATLFIPHLIEVGVDVLNPVQPESMDFPEVYKTYGGKLSFHGTIGTQTTMPFGTPEEVKAKVREHLALAAEHGGLFVAPTHLLEPEVPWENIMAYVEACREYKVK